MEWLIDLIFFIIGLGLGIFGFSQIIGSLQIRQRRFFVPVILWVAILSIAAFLVFLFLPMWLVVYLIGYVFAFVGNIRALFRGDFMKEYTTRLDNYKSVVLGEILLLSKDRERTASLSYADVAIAITNLEDAYNYLRRREFNFVNEVFIRYLAMTEKFNVGYEKFLEMRKTIVEEYETRVPYALFDGTNSNMSDVRANEILKSYLNGKRYSEQEE